MSLSVAVRECEVVFTAVDNDGDEVCTMNFDPDCVDLTTEEITLERLQAPDGVHRHLHNGQFALAVDAAWRFTFVLGQEAGTSSLKWSFADRAACEAFITGLRVGVERALGFEESM